MKNIINAKFSFIIFHLNVVTCATSKTIFLQEKREAASSNFSVNWNLDCVWERSEKDVIADKYQHHFKLVQK